MERGAFSEEIYFTLTSLPSAATNLIVGHNVFLPEAASYEAVPPNRRTNVRTYGVADTEGNEQTLVQSLADLWTTEISNCALVSLRRVNSESHLTVRETLFEQLRPFIPSFEDFRYFVGLFVDDSHRTDYPPLLFRPIRSRGDVGQAEGQAAWEGFELIYGFGYFDYEPRLQREGTSQWPLRRTVLYHQHRRSSQAQRMKSLWILVSAQSHVEHVLSRCLRTWFRNAAEPLEPHIILHQHCFRLWRRPAVKFGAELHTALIQPYGALASARTDQGVQNAWRRSLSGTEVADLVEDASHAAEALTADLELLQHHHAKFSILRSSGDEDAEASETGPIKHLLHECQAFGKTLRRDFDILQRKAQRTATLYSRLSELRHEDFNALLKEIQDSTSQLARRNRDFEDQKDNMDRINHINSNISRSLTILSATLLPVGMWGSFFSLTKLVDRSNWGYYWLAVLGSWVALALAFYLWGVLHGWWSWIPWKEYQGKFRTRRHSN